MRGRAQAADAALGLQQQVTRAHRPPARGPLAAPSLAACFKVPFDPEASMAASWLKRMILNSGCCDPEWGAVARVWPRGRGSVWMTRAPWSQHPDSGDARNEDTWLNPALVLQR